MGMATFTKNENILNEEFSELETLYNIIKNNTQISQYYPWE